jgi:DNA-binding response OmpR family regulator
MAKRVLIVDDDQASCDVMADLLNGLGYEAMCEKEPLHLLAQAVNFDPHLILLDWRMPSEDGDAALVNLRDRGILTPVIMVSGMADPNTGAQFRRMALALGAQDFVRKPFDLNDLEHRVENLIGTPDD